MRANSIATWGMCALVLASCAHEERRMPAGPQGSNEPPPSPSFAPPQYVIADPSGARTKTVMLPLGARGAVGLAVDKRRIVAGQGEPRVALDTAPDALVGASQIPVRFGGGFLFWTARAIYRADAFDSKLVPVSRMPDAIETISFGPKFLLVRTHNGERWGLGLPNGERAAVLPLGIADVQALDDGRAIAMSDQGVVLTSTDHGAHWTDATAQLRSSPSKVTVVAGDVWLLESNGGASRLDSDGHFSWFDKEPVDPAADVRPQDPRWRGTETPLHLALHAGASIDDSTAIVIDSGDVFRVDVHTGQLLSVVSGHIPPDARCEAVPAFGDVLFACAASRNAGASAFVVSHTLSSESVTVEQTFVGGGQFFVSDDGGLAYAGSCQGVPAGPAGAPVVCVRTPGGRWEERDLSGLVPDAGASDIDVARWVPRSDGRVVAIVVGPSPGIYDPQVASFQPIAAEVREVVGQGALSYPLQPGKHAHVRLKPRGHGSGLVDSSWSFGSGNTLHGWQRHGESVELSEDGKLKRSPYAFDVVFAGSMGLGRSKDGRLYQSLDHGASWSEVATPPSGADALDLASCTSVGCDLGAFYRVGWSLRPPHDEPPKTPAPPAPEVRRTRGLELSCRPQGGVTARTLPHSNDSPDDLGLGASRLPVANDKNEWSYVRNTVARAIVNAPTRDAGGGDSESAPSLRAVFSGFGTTRDGDVITVTGPNKNAFALRRGVAYVAPFDPLGRVVRTSIAMSDVVAAGRRAGMTTDEILAEDFTETGSVVTLTSADATAPSDIVIHNVDHGLLAFMHGERVRVAIRASQNNANVISGVVLGGSSGAAEEAAFLEVEPNGAGRVFKLGSSGISELFDVGSIAAETYYPANPDALAVGPKGELAILRTPSGSDPPSVLDPALLLVQAMPPVALAPWSELKLADDPVCKAESGGFRAALQIIGPWIRVTAPELRVEDAPMIARVRWSPKRVCLEGFEVRLPSVGLRIAQPGGGYESGTLGTWLVGKGSSFARIGVADGIEWRQALDCAIVATP
jgi:hypothetical protein